MSKVRSGQIVIQIVGGDPLLVKISVKEGCVLVLSVVGVAGPQEVSHV